MGLEAWNTQPHAHPLERGEGLENELTVDRAYTRKPLQKSPKSETQSWQAHPRAESVARPNSLGTEAPTLRVLLHPPYVALHMAVHSYPLKYPL